MSTSTTRLWLRLWPLHLLGVVAIAVCVAGGLWQLGSYESQQNDAVEQAREQVVPIEDLWAVGEPFSGDLVSRVVSVEGRYGPAGDQFWVRGEATGDRAWLVAPFEVAGSAGSLLVVRGSAAEPGALPDPPGGPRTLRVSLQPSAGGGTPLDADRVTSAITVPALLNELPQRLWSGYGIVDEPVEAGLAAVAPPDPDVSWTVGLVNLAYAFQWWAFALFAAFMWWRMCTDQVSEARARRTQSVPDEETPA